MAFFGEFGTDKHVRERYFSDYSVRGIMVEVGVATPEYLSMSKHFKDSGWALASSLNPTRNLPRCIGPAEMRSVNMPPEVQMPTMSTSRWFMLRTTMKAVGVTDHSYSALKVKDEYKAIDPNFNQLNLTKIMRPCLDPLDTGSWPRDCPDDQPRRFPFRRRRGVGIGSAWGV